MSTELKEMKVTATCLSRGRIIWWSRYSAQEKHLPRSARELVKLEWCGSADVVMDQHLACITQLIEETLEPSRASLTLCSRTDQLQIVSL